MNFNKFLRISMNFKRKSKAFTLIEMLIVITIIALLASLILVGMGGARAKTRDARRVADLHNIMNGLELYYAKIGSYPVGTYTTIAGWTTFKTTLTDAGIGVNRVPDDPLNATTYYYRYGGTTTNYVLGAALEQDDAVLKNDIDGTTIGIDCADTSFVYCVQP